MRATYRLMFHAFPPFLRGSGAQGDCSLFEPPPVRGVDTSLFLFLSCIFLAFLLLALSLTFVIRGAPIQCCGGFFGNTWKRISTTNISSLVPMKNVAKCDT